MALSEFHLFCLNNPSLAQDLGIIDPADYQTIREMYGDDLELLEPYLEGLEGLLNHGVASQPIEDVAGTRGQKLYPAPAFNSCGEVCEKRCPLYSI